ncbi:MAG: hypothetical protein GY794_23145, partial [bacterium]|nr:hypothetical protein [bacterium]
MMSILATTLAAGPMSIPAIVGLVILLIAVLVFLVMFGPLFGLWIQALAAHANVGIFQLIGMRLRKVHPATIVIARIQAVRAGIDLSTDQLETHFLAGGRPTNVVRA